MQAVCYLRAITDPSLEVQQRAYLDECTSAGLEVGPTYTETASGSSAPEFRRMLRILLEGQREFVVVVVGAIEALGDTAREQAKRYLQLAALGIPLRVAGARDPDTAMLAAWERRTNAERRREQVRAGMRDVALRGEVLGRPPYGYRVVARRLRVDADEAVVVRDIFRRYLELNEGVRVIARHLNEAGTRTRRGGAWSMVSVREVLRNPVYVGTYRRLGVLVPSDHERLITREQFADVQTRLAERRTSFTRQARGEYLLAGLAVCGYCENKLIGVRRASRAQRATGEPAEVFTYYQCQSRTNQSRCDYHTRRADDLESAVRNAISDAFATTSVAPNAVLPPDASEARREGLRRRLDALLERRVRGEWTAEQLRQEAGQLALEDLQEEEREEFEARRRQDAARTSEDATTVVTERARLVEQWGILEFDEHRALLRALVTRVVVMDDAVRVELAQ
ncbi:MAG: recombinase family protein [Chloroflexota bacterium]